jgi:aldehyde dehydrogenase (NAD+)
MVVAPELETEDVKKYGLFIDGEFQAAEADETIDVDFPYNGEVWARVPNGSSADVERAVRSAGNAFRNGEWSGLLPSERREILDQIGDVVDAHSEELGRLETLQNGKLIREMQSQTEIVGDWYRYYGSLCDKIEGRVIPVEPKDGQFHNYTRKEPLGVVGGITPWNSPLLLLAFKLAPALAAGNTFVHKPSEHTPVSALRFAELLYEETDLPDGVYNVVPGGGATGEMLSQNADLDKLSFTGSTPVGRQVAQTAGEQLIPASVELGGKSPNIVFADADLDNALNGAVKGIFAASGQTCVAGSRILVQETIAEEFVDRLAKKAANVKIGNPLESDTEMGPIAFPGQWQKIREYIDIGKDEGAMIAYGGERPEELPGECFIEPTIITEASNEMQVAQEEIFGPVAVVITFTDEEEAVELANQVDYGLAAGVWTGDMQRAHRIVKEIQAGTVWVNEYRTLTYSSPFGGYKQSGLGRENGREGLNEYLQVKSVWIDTSGEVDDPFTLGLE